MGNEYTFGEAIELLKKGAKVCRKGWNGKGMFVFLHEGDVSKSGKTFPTDPCLAMKTAGNTIQPGWNASQADILAEDWHVLE